MYLELIAHNDDGTALPLRIALPNLETRDFDYNSEGDDIQELADTARELQQRAYAIISPRPIRFTHKTIEEAVNEYGAVAVIEAVRGLIAPAKDDYWADITAPTPPGVPYAVWRDPETNNVMYDWYLIRQAAAQHNVRFSSVEGWVIHTDRRKPMTADELITKYLAVINKD